MVPHARIRLVFLLSMTLYLTRMLRRGVLWPVFGSASEARAVEVPPPTAPRTSRAARVTEVSPQAGAEKTRAAPPRPVSAPRSRAIAWIAPGERRCRLPELGIVAALGVLTVAGADALSRSGHGGGEPLFWLGLLTPLALAAARLASPDPSRHERLGIVVLVGMTLYLVKVLKDPFTFMYSDEFVHAHNAQRVLDSGGLFSENPLLPVTAHYPGLASVTSAVASVTGLHVFGAGLIVVGSARLLMMVALFLLFEDVSGSARIAGLAALIYTAHPNFIFFDGQYAYESLAFPLAVFAVASVNHWSHKENKSARRGWALATLLAITAVAITHHMTMYALTAFLLVASLLHALVPRRWRANPWPFALFAAGVTTGWLVFIASDTVGYLTFIFGTALEDTIRTLSLESAPRGLFRSNSRSGISLSESAVGLASVALIAVLMPMALREMWHRYRRNPVAILFAAAAVAYLLMLFLRFVPGAWEVANRTSAFLFLGVAFMLALAAERAIGLLPRAVGRGVVAAAVALLIAGGLVAGWPRDLRLSLPYRIDANGPALEPQGTTAARWSRSELGTGLHFLADPSNARLALAQGEVAFAGGNPNLNDILRGASLDPWMVIEINRIGAQYVVVDRRRISDDHMLGNYFTSRPAERAGLYPAFSYEKFERQPGVSKVYDSGDIAIYELERFRYHQDFR
jgi:hypothetical protein